ncbi:MAG TPA: hypothetical protein VKA21_06970 [Candidatus Binatia bacterium]|nr:hypothetical protein [Candidatus Binatia bacterium]
MTVAVLLIALLAPALATAGSISISISPVVEVRDGKLTGTVQVTNSGDEAAHAVAPVLRFRDQEIRGEGRDALGPNQSMKSALALPVGDLKPGRWPYRLSVDYADANQYPFQALHVGSVLVGSVPPSKVSVTAVKADPLAGSGSLSVKLKNLSAVARDVSIMVVVPEGVEVSDPVETVALAPWAETSVSARLVNRTALAGSRYPVFIAAEYDEDAAHQAAIGQGVLEISNPRSFFQQQKNLLWVLAGVVVVAWMGFLTWQLATGRARRATPPRP